MIEPGTVIASTADLGGSLAVTRGGKIFVNGTREEPVIMTSTTDVATWTPDPSHPSGGDPKSGTWREGINEWGNLTIMGNGLISGSHFGGDEISITTDDDGLPGGTVTMRTNTKVPDGLNQRQMEGLTAGFPGDPKVLYGGADDDDDSGAIHYLSIRYTGKVIGLGNELNGLSLGAVGRETEIDHIEIMNNVDDGIEIWGGTVNLKNINIWNVGDDSFDVDQGWRGKSQFGLIVQGYGTDASQGSGVGDNCIETDGAEDSDSQPVTTSTFYNFTVVGQPIGGDHGTAWRDNARVQYRNFIFMELGERLLRNDNSDGDGGSGYGFNGTLTFAETWATAAGTHSSINAATESMVGDFNHPEMLYSVQQNGNLAEISDSVFFNNLHPSAYSDADSVGVREAANNNVTAATVSLPIQSITRADPVQRGGLTMLRVTKINPTAANDAVTSSSAAPDDGFFTPAQFRGGFGPNTRDNWLLGWTAADAFGFVASDSLISDLDGDGAVGPKDLLILMGEWTGTD